MQGWQSNIVCSVSVVARDHNSLGLTEQQPDLNILTVYSQYMYSCINYVRDNLPELKYEHNYNARSKDNVAVSRHRPELSKK